MRGVMKIDTSEIINKNILQESKQKKTIILSTSFSNDIFTY